MERLIDMEFDDLATCKEAVNATAAQASIKVALHRSSPRHIVWRCGRGRRYKRMMSEVEAPKQRKSSTKMTGCPFQIKAKVQDSGRWRIEWVPTEHSKTHNHPIADGSRREDSMPDDPDLPTLTQGPYQHWKGQPLHPVASKIQQWTKGGFPIVDGKYLDTLTETGTLKTLESDDLVVAGPPVIDVYWHNRSEKWSANAEAEGASRRFKTCATSAFVDVTEYLTRVGHLLSAAQGACQVWSLNATQYSVNVVLNTEMTEVAMMGLLASWGLILAQ